MYALLRLYNTFWMILRGVYTAFHDRNDWIMHESVMHVFFVYTAYQSHEQLYLFPPNQYICK